MAQITFAEHGPKDEVEQGEFFKPKFNAGDLFPVCEAAESDDAEFVLLDTDQA
ncbi:MAG: hypothetical protein AAF532_00005 [Planctomycetota bacterium]